MNFEYNKSLDSKMLKELYDEDYEYAADMFETFLDYVVPQFDELYTMLDSENREELKKIAHKIKPNFTMVGLPFMQDKMKAIEIGALEEPDFTKVRNQVQEVGNLLKDYVSILSSDLEKLKQLF